MTQIQHQLSHDVHTVQLSKDRRGAKRLTCYADSTFPLSKSPKIRKLQIAAIKHLEELIPSSVLSQYHFVWDKFKSHSSLNVLSHSSWVPVFQGDLQITTVEASAPTQGDSASDAVPFTMASNSPPEQHGGDPEMQESDGYMQRFLAQLVHIVTEHERGLYGMLSITQLDSFWGKRWRRYLPAPFGKLYEDRRVIAVFVRQLMDVQPPRKAAETLAEGHIDTLELDQDALMAAVFLFLYGNVPREFTTPIEKLGEYLNAHDRREDLRALWKLYLDCTVLYDQ